MNKMNNTINTDDYFESKILDYQRAIENQRQFEADDIFIKICEIYKPEKYLLTWQRQYLYLYDSIDDFKQEYMKVFVTALRKWKPREERKKSRYGGAGTFKNYFWGSLNHNFINLVKSIEGAAKRNVSVRCPECSKWHNPISTHIIKNHADILWSKLNADGIDIDTIVECPFCKSNIYKGKAGLTGNGLIKKHILSKHLYMLFDAFGEKHTDFIGGNVKYFSADTNYENDNEYSSIYDTTPSSQSLLDKLLTTELSEIQKKMIDNIISKKGTQFKYSYKMYKCSEAHFNEELEKLKDKIILFEDI